MVGWSQRFYLNQTKYHESTKISTKHMKNWLSMESLT